jgi:hypothetical protein
MERMVDSICTRTPLSPMHLLLPLFLCLLSTDALASPAHRSVEGHSTGVHARDQRDHRHRELAGSARRAAEALGKRQQGPGYWLTAFTDEARFEKPRQELNTFTNAMMVDILDPVAKSAGITHLLGRTRAFLSSQIEPDGLVRYHGRPDGPANREVWRCAITPDSDDTALVWRIAPGADRELLSRALATLGRFRAANGLYKTWLAPQDRYECIDPGSDPNPTDIAIQMHVLMLLAQVDGPAALALCGALSKELSNDNAWVYYTAMAPLVPMLRLADMRKAGCPLQLPQARLQTALPHQRVWVEVVDLLGRLERAPAASVDHSRAADLLHQLSTGGFSLLASSPPLLYHNDFTARTRRFYWSEDVGYALWLRLYFEIERARPGPHEPAPT